MSRFPALQNAPIADKRPRESEFHGTVLHDDYFWMRAENWQEALREPEKLPEDIKDYLTQENAYYETAMADTAELQENLVAEMRGRIKEDDTSVPQKDGPFSYWTKFDEGKEYPVFLRQPFEGGSETVLLDVNKEAAAHEYFSLGTFAVSPNHEMIAWSADTSGSELYQLDFRVAGAQENIGEGIADVGSVAWGDNETLFYTRVDENHRPSKVFRHKLGTDQSQDVLIYEENDPRFFCGVGSSRSEQFVFISTGMNDQDEAWFIPCDNLEAEPICVEPRTEGLEYSVDHQKGDDGGNFLILTNADGAEDFKIVKTPVSKPGRANWSDLVSHKQGRMILSLDVFEDYTIWMERENALPKICFMDHDGKIDQIAFEEEAYSLGISPSPEYTSDMLRFSYSSMSTPTQQYDYNLKTGERTLLKEQEIPSGHDPHQYIVHRAEARSHDGEMVPYTLVHHIDTPIDGSAPCLLYGYGSYGHSMPASFSSGRLSLLDRGFVYCIAHIRGGEEKGRRWYENAKFGQKVNTFHDFIAVGEALCENHFTNEGNIVIQGGSAGGLLVGATVNMAPSLFAGVIADVPFVDVLNTILDDTLPLTPGEWSQWGNPIESIEAFNDISGYSPYDNVEKKDYPPMLVTAGVSDPRVTYWEPAKWVAKLRVSKTDDNILMLRTNMSSGHFGKTGRFAGLEDAARSYAFALKATGKV